MGWPDLSGLVAGLLATDGLGWLIGAALLAGIVRGFSGFGTAMVFLPVAARFVEPFQALTLLTAMDLIGPLPILPRAVREGDPPDILRLLAGLVIGLPLGLATLMVLSPDAFRYGVSGLTLALLALLVGGVRYAGRLTTGKVVATGGLSGFTAGVAGLAGPPVILFYMASPLPVAAIRANVLLFLVASDVAMLAVLAVFGRLEAGMLGLGLALVLPYMLATAGGARLFRPGNARLYRWVAYGLIAASALAGLPLLD